MFHGCTSQNISRKQAPVGVDSRAGLDGCEARLLKMRSWVSRPHSQLPSVELARLALRCSASKGFQQRTYPASLSFSSKSSASGLLMQVRDRQPNQINQVVTSNLREGCQRATGVRHKGIS